MTNFEQIVAILGEPTKTFNDSFARQISHWWVSRSQEDFDKVKALGEEICHAGAAIIHGRTFNINYVEDVPRDNQENT